MAIGFSKIRRGAVTPDDKVFVVVVLATVVGVLPGTWKLQKDKGNLYT